jgi:hypothetical protein
MSVNVENIDKTIARIRQNQNFRFNMKNWGAMINNEDEMVDQEHFCGTSACIAGFAVLAAEKYPIKKVTNQNGVVLDMMDIGTTWASEQNDIFLRDGAEILGLSLAQANTLFMPFSTLVYDEDTKEYPRSPDYFKATADQAITVLEYLKETGIVDWSKSGIKGEAGFEEAFRKCYDRDYLPPVGPDEEKVSENA